MSKQVITIWSKQWHDMTKQTLTNFLSRNFGAQKWSYLYIFVVPGGPGPYWDPGPEASASPASWMIRRGSRTVCAALYTPLLRHGSTTATVCIFFSYTMVCTHIATSLLASGSSVFRIVHRAGSSMRLVRLKPQGPGPDRGPECPVQRKFTTYYKDHCGPRNF